MTIAKKGDILERDNKLYSVICADEEYFITARMELKGDHYTTHFNKLEAYSNTSCINTLEELGFTKTNLNEKG